MHVERNTSPCVSRGPGVENYVVNWFSKRDNLSLSHFPFTTCAETSVIPSHSPAQTHNSVAIGLAQNNSCRIEMQISELVVWRKEFARTSYTAGSKDRCGFLSDTRRVEASFSAPHVSFFIIYFGRRTCN